jgi:integrase
VNKSTAAPNVRKPACWNVAGFSIPRPANPNFSLTPHKSGKWYKKLTVGGVARFIYVGAWARLVNGKMETVPEFGWREAWEEFKARADALYSGKEPEPTADDEPTVGRLCNAFRTAMERRHEVGKMSAAMIREYISTCDLMVQTFGGKRLVTDLKPAHFAELGATLAARFGPVRLGNEIQRVRTAFKWGLENEVLAAVPRYGSEFKKPSRTELRRHRAAQGPRTFMPSEVHALLGAADATLKAMILCGLNCGYGNGDCAAVPLSAIDLDGGWATFGRPKTGIDRKAKLWPETQIALRAYLAVRPKPTNTEAARHLFVSRYGTPWPAAAVSHKFTKLAQKLGINGSRGFYALRHSFRTASDGSMDTPAIRKIMGHVDGAIDDTYRHAIDDCRLEAVADHVRKVFGFGTEGGAA